MNGQRVRSSHMLKVGDEMAITKPNGVYRVTVLSIPVRRGPAKEAKLCYQLDEEPAPRQKSMVDIYAAAPEKRPDKKDRRKLRELKGKR